MYIMTLSIKTSVHLRNFKHDHLYTDDQNKNRLLILASTAVGHPDKRLANSVRAFNHAPLNQRIKFYYTVIDGKMEVKVHIDDFHFHLFKSKRH